MASALKSTPYMDAQPREDYNTAYKRFAAMIDGWTDEPPSARRASRLNPGAVKHTKSLAGLEQAAGELESKGVCWSRSEHPQASLISLWTEKQEEDEHESFAKESIMLVQNPADTHHGVGCCAEHTTIRPKKKPRRSKPASDVSAACRRLVAKLPKGQLREAVRADAEALSASMMRMCPEVPKLTLQLEVIGNNRCSRWHQDYYAGRMLITYNATSTWMADDQSVSFSMFDDSIELPSEITDPLVVPDYESIHQPPPNSVVLIKGMSWPGIERSANGMGVVHKAPNMRKRAGDDDEPICKRFILKVDLQYDDDEW